MYVVSEASEVQPGIAGRTQAVVDSSLVTRHVGGSGVLGTPMMILLMEQTAHDSVDPLLGDDQTTVGYEVCVRHLAAVELGQAVVVTSLLKEVHGNRLLFDVTCTHGDTLVGTGTHKRAIVAGRR